MNPSKFSFPESVANSADGKTSGGKLYGAIIAGVGLLNFTVAVFFLNKNVNIVPILTACFGVVSLGASMFLGKIFKPSEKNVVEKEN